MSDYPARVYVAAPTEHTQARASPVPRLGHVEYIRADVAIASAMLAAVSAAAQIEEGRLLEICRVALKKASEAMP